MTGGTAQRDDELRQSKECTGSNFLVQAQGRDRERRVAEVNQSQAGLFMKAGALGGLSPCS